MSDEPNMWLILALLGGNLYQGAARDKTLTREQSQWDTEIAAEIISELKEIKERCGRCNDS